MELSIVLKKFVSSKDAMRVKIREKMNPILGRYRMKWGGGKSLI